MTRSEVISEIQHYFVLKELVCEHAFSKLGESAWRVFPTFALENLLVLRRDIIAMPMVCNTKALHQRGFRCNMCPIVKEKTEAYLSGHCLGVGWDFTVQGMTAEQARRRIVQKCDLLPYNCRIEAGVNWLHFDCIDTGMKVYEFRV